MTDNASKPSRNRLPRAVRILGTLTALALLLFLLLKQDWQDIRGAVQLLSPETLGVCIALMFLSRLAVCSRWYFLLRSSSQTARFAQVAKITFSGLFSTNFLPTTIGGDAVRFAGAVRSGFDASVIAASLIVDRLIGMLGMVMTLPIGIHSLLNATEAQPLAHGLLICAASISFNGKVGWRRWKKIIEKEVNKVNAALSLWKSQPRELFKSLVFTWVHMLCLFSILYLLFRQMDESLPYWRIAGLYSLVYFVTLFPISLNGYGIQEVSMTYILSQLGGASMETSLVVALLFRTLMMFASLPGAFFAPGILLSMHESN